ncbi:MAG TPA: hypothetical protein VGL39_06795 [Jatrophihabitantaceae bacterium]
MARQSAPDNSAAARSGDAQVVDARVGGVPGPMASSPDSSHPPMARVIVARNANTMAVARSGVMAAAGADELLLGPGGVLFGAEWLPLLHATKAALPNMANIVKADRPATPYD